MKATYFPFTYIAEPTADMLAECFGQIIVYRPATETFSEQMQLRINREAVDVRVPISGNETELNNAIKNYLSWADLHRDSAGEKAAIINAGGNPIPFFSELSARKIATDIRGGTTANSNTRNPDPELTARIFLYFAQEFDRHNQELTAELSYQQQREAELIRQLKMENDPAAAEFQTPPVQLPEPFADYMVSDRLEAWTRIFCRDPEASGLFVTHSAAVLDLLLERNASAVRVVHLEASPSGQTTDGERKSRRERLASKLARLLEQDAAVNLDNSLELPDVSEPSNPATMSIYRVPDQSPYEFFTRCAGMNCPPAGGPLYKSPYKNTLIALVQAPLSL